MYHIMTRMEVKIKAAVTASMVLLASAFSALAETRSKNELDRLHEALVQSEQNTAVGIERNIVRLWELSGSVSVDFLYKNGDDALEAKDFKAAVDHFSAVIEFAPEFAMGWYGRSRAYANLSYDGPALADLEQTLALNPKNFLAILGLGQLFQRLGRPDLALKAYDQALIVHPNFSAALELKEAMKAYLQDKNT